MRRVEFMRELSNLLQDLSDADREEALRYYNDYFEDAGPENEEAVAEELGTPEKVAAMIKAGLLEDDKTQGSFTDTGYTDERFSGDERMPGPYESGRSGERGTFRRTEEDDPYHYTSQPEPHKKKRRKGIWKLLLIVLLALCALPILAPLLIVLAVVLLVLIVTAVVIVLAFALSGIAIVISGILALGSGIAKLFLVPATGLFICGAALLVIALGIIVAWGMWWLLFKVLPPVLNALIRILRRPFERKENAS